LLEEQGCHWQWEAGFSTDHTSTNNLIYITDIEPLSQVESADVGRARLSATIRVRRPSDVQWLSVGVALGGCAIRPVRKEDDALNTDLVIDTDTEPC
jgi:hypothetical protein